MSFNVGGDRSPVRLERLLQAMEARYPEDARPTFFLDNHDMSRFANYSTDRRRLRAGFAFLSTLSGHLALYYGTETGLISPRSEWGEHASQQPMPWGELDEELVDWFRKVIAVRREHASLVAGTRLPLHADERTLVMAKVADTERALVGVNLSREEVTVEVEVGALLAEGAPGSTVLGTTEPEIRSARARWTSPPVSTSVYVQPGATAR